MGGANLPQEVVMFVPFQYCGEAPHQFGHWRKSIRSSPSRAQGENRDSELLGQGDTQGKCGVLGGLVTVRGV